LTEFISDGLISTKLKINPMECHLNSVYPDAIKSVNLNALPYIVFSVVSRVVDISFTLVLLCSATLGMA